MKIQHIIAATSLLLTVACTEDVEVNNINGEGEITFSISDTEDWKSKDVNTRGTSCQLPLLENGKVSALSLTATQTTSSTATRSVPTTSITGSLGVSGYAYPANGDMGNATVLMENVEATLTGSSYQLATPYYWPQNQCAQFFAYTPYVASNTTAFALGFDATQHMPTITMTVNENDIAHHTDLMVAESGAKTFNGSAVDLSFKHALTCVRFQIGSITGLSGDIKRVSLKKVVKSGTYTFGIGWTVGTDSADFNITGLQIPLTSVMYTPIKHDGDTNGANSTLLMIPQTFTAGSQTIEVEYKPTGSTGTVVLTAPLKTSSWEPGTTVTYYLNATGTSILPVLDASSVTIGHGGGKGQFVVASYIDNGNGTYTNVPWEVSGYSLDGVNFTKEKPASCSWAGISTTSGNGGVADYGTVSVEEQAPDGGSTAIGSEADANTNQTAIMKARAAKRKDGEATVSNPWDLSTHDLNGNHTLRNTANCYVVNAPGVYKIPLVYGNAVKDGQPNTSAYSSTTFVDHNGTNIADPYITTLHSPTSAELLWQDSPSLITNVSLRDGYLVFELTEANLKQGNAVVAVKDGSTILWSWHLWVTAADVNSYIKCTSGNYSRYDFMPLNLGWVFNSGTEYKYKGRTLYVKVRQPNGQEAIFAVSQTNGIEYEGAYHGTGTVYQAGRKDPLGMPTGTSNTDGRSLYGNTKPSSSDVSVGNYYKGISSPTVYFCYRNTYLYWCNSLPYNCWDASATTYGPTSANPHQRGVKTIYDPSPVGYHVPEYWSMAFWAHNDWYTSPSVTNVSSKTLSEIKKVFNVAANFDSGWLFYTDWTYRKTIFFPVNGCLTSGGYNSVWSGYWTNHLFDSNSQGTIYWACTWNNNKYEFQLWDGEGNGPGIYIRPNFDLEY
jgi:hypothetical protein